MLDIVSTVVYKSSPCRVYLTGCLNDKANRWMDVSIRTKGVLRGEGIKSIHFHMIVAKNVDHKKVFVMRIMIANPNLL